MPVCEAGTTSIQAADAEGLAGLKCTELRLELTPVDGGRREPRQIHWRLRFPKHGDQPADVVAMLVSHQHRIDRLRLLADGFETLEELLAADAGVDKDACVAVPDEYRVPGAAARENTDSEDIGS